MKLDEEIKDTYTLLENQFKRLEQLDEPEKSHYVRLASQNYFLLLFPRLQRYGVDSDGKELPPSMKVTSASSGAECEAGSGWRRYAASRQPNKPVHYFVGVPISRRKPTDTRLNRLERLALVRAHLRAFLYS